MSPRFGMIRSVLLTLVACVGVIAIGASAPAAHAADPPALASEAASEYADSSAGEQKGEITDFSVLNYITAVVVFVLALVILSKTAWPKITKGLDEREAKILNEIENAERARAEAEEARQSYAKELANAKAEATRMLEEARAEQARLSADLKQQAETELNEMRTKARQQIEAAQQAAINELYAEAGNLATAIAAKILQREVNEDDQRRLVEETLGEISREFAGSSA